MGHVLCGGDSAAEAYTTGWHAQHHHKDAGRSLNCMSFRLESTSSDPIFSYSAAAGLLSMSCAEVARGRCTHVMGAHQPVPHQPSNSVAQQHLPDQQQQHHSSCSARPKRYQQQQQLWPAVWHELCPCVSSLQQDAYGRKAPLCWAAAVLTQVLS